MPVYPFHHETTPSFDRFDPIGSDALSSSSSSPSCVISIDGVEVFRDSISSLRQKWEKTSFELEKLQTNPECVEQEEEEMRGDKEEMKMGEIKEEEVKEMEGEVRTKEEDEDICLHIEGDGKMRKRGK